MTSAKWLNSTLITPKKLGYCKSSLVPSIWALLIFESASVVTTPLAGTPKRTPKTKTSQTLASAIKRKAVKDDGDEDDEAPVSAKKVKSSAESDVDEV